MAPSCPHSSNKVVSTSVLSGILLQLGTQSGDFRRRPTLGSCNIRSQRVWPACDCPHMLSVMSGSFSVDRAILLRSAIPTALPSHSRITGCFPTSQPSISSSWSGQIAVDTWGTWSSGGAQTRGASVFGTQEVVAAPTDPSPNCHARRYRPSPRR